jgi:transcriptional antiterminator NusG
MGKTFVPLSKDDKSWIERWTQQGDRSIPISFAYKKGDTIVVTDGPLVGLEGMITRVNRRRRVAHVEIHAGQVTIHTTVGLEVMPAPEA